MAEEIVVVPMSEENVAVLVPEERIPSDTNSNQINGTSFIKSCYNASGTFLGIGVLTVPYALAKGGWLSLVLFFLTAILAFYTSILLKRCMDASETPITSYHSIVEASFGRKGRIIAYVTANLELYLICVGLLILEGDNLQKLFPHFELIVAKKTIGAQPLFVVIAALAILPSILPSRLGIVSYISAIGLLATIVVVIAVICVGAETVGAEFNGNGKALIAIGGLPTSASLFIACFGGHPVIPTLYAGMANKRNFTKAMVVSFTMDTLIYFSLALIGYLMYGSKVKPQITLNLPTNELGSKVAIYAILVIPITKYALMITPVANALQIGPFVHKGRLLKTLLLVSTTVIACVFPYFESLMTVAGSTFLVLASFVLPCCCYLKISGAQNRSYEYWGVAGIVALASLAGITGTYSSIAQVIRNM